MAKRRPQNQIRGEVSDFAAQHGEYIQAREKMPDGRTAIVLKNRGASTLDRWRAAGSLTPAQENAIDLYIRCHRLCFDDARTVASYSPTAAIRSTGADPEGRQHARVQAMRTLKLIDDEVFSRMPLNRRGVFRNVVLYDTPTAMAGNSTGSLKARQAAVKEAVLFVADLIDIAVNRRRAA